MNWFLSFRKWVGWREGELNGLLMITHSIRKDRLEDSRLGEVIQLRKIIPKYSVFLSLFGTRVGRNRPAYSFGIQTIPFLNWNYVKYYQTWDIFEPFYMFLPYLTLTKRNNCSFWIYLSDQTKSFIPYDLLIIWHYSTFYDKSCQIIHFNLFRFHSFYD